MSRTLGRSTRSPHLQSLDAAVASDTSFSPYSHDSSLPRPHSRLRILRRTEHLLPRTVSPSPPPQVNNTSNQHRHSSSVAAMSSRSVSQRMEATLAPHVEAAASSAVPPPPPVTDQPPPSEASEREPLIRHPLSARIDWFHDIRDDFDHFEPFSLDQQQDLPSSFYNSSPGTDSLGEVTRPALSPFIARQSSDRTVDR